MIATMDPWQAAVVVGEGHAPFWQYFLPLRSRQTSPLLPPKNADP
jgi:hypothetical protein